MLKNAFQIKSMISNEYLFKVHLNQIISSKSDISIFISIFNFAKDATLKFTAGLCRPEVAEYNTIVSTGRRWN